MTNRKVHEGRNVKRFREMLGIKQDALAYELGEGRNQKKISLLEQKEALEPALLKQIAEALRTPEEAINIISNTFHDTQGLINYNPTFNNNPIDQLIKLHEEKIALYERMLKEKDEMMGRLKRLISSK